MKTTRFRLSAASATAAACLVIAAFQSRAQEIAPPPDGPIGDAGVPNFPQNDGYDALTRGALHEAFASPYVSDPAPGVIVEEQPPEPIDEVPPGQMPAGESIVWIPGYWGWDPDEDDFIWISGVWRDVPADRRWIPGYWTGVDEGWQWVPGFWTSAETDQLVYRPVPPETLEQGPNVAPPDGDYFWIPGCWLWQEVQYEWRPGYWAPSIADWVWIPDQHIWTPYGCVFVPGYWDFALVDRGMMFAPVHFTSAVYREPAFRYVPTVVIDPAPLLIHLFVSPTYSHYYYGDYYAFQPRGPQFDFYPWYAYHDRPSLYDPLLTYYQWSYARQDVNIVQRLYSWNQYFVRHEDYRPPHTFRAQREFLARIDRDSIPIQPTTLAFGQTLPDYIESRSSHVDFRPVTEPTRERIVERTQALQQFQQERSRFEVATTAPDRGDLTLPRGDENRPGRADARSRRTLELPGATIVGDAGRPRETLPGREPGETETPDATTPEGEAGSRRPQLPPRPEPSVGDDAVRPGDRSAGNRGPRDREPGVDRPDEGRPDLDRPGRDADRPGFEGDEPGRDRPDAPGLDRPGLDRPGLDRPSQERPGQGRPDMDRSGQERSGDEQPARDRPRPGQRSGDRPDIDRPDATDRRPETSRPGDRAGVPGERQGPQFPRFGTNRGRDRDVGGESGTEVRPERPDINIRPDQRTGDEAQRERGRTGRSGFDPFGALPPGLGEGAAPDRPDRTPGTGSPLEREPRGRQRGPDLPSPDLPRPGSVPRAGNAPGAVPGAGERPAPQQPRADRPQVDRPGAGNNSNAGRSATPPNRPQTPPPSSPQANPNRPEAPPAANPPAKKPKDEKK